MLCLSSHHIWHKDLEYIKMEPEVLTQYFKVQDYGSYGNHWDQVSALLVVYLSI